MAKRNPIEITFYFNTIEEAIATLGSLVQKAAPVANLEKPAQPLVIETKVTKPRKPRADAGQKRGPYKKVEAPKEATADSQATGEAASGPDASAASTPETAPPEASAQQEATAAQPLTPEAGAAPTEAEVQAAIDKVFSAKGLKAAMAALDSFGVKRGRDLKPEDRAAFIQKAEEIANG